MQLKHVTTVVSPGDGIAKVTAFAWSPNNAKLAVVSTDRVVSLYDCETFEKKDKFSTKPADSSGPRTYIVRALAWNPDSTLLAVAQSDCIVFVYKLAASPETAGEWGAKKSIINKFVQQEGVTSMVWPKGQPRYVIFGTSSGKIRCGDTKRNKSDSLYNVGSPCISLAVNTDGTGFVSGHADGTIYRFYFDNGGGAAPQGILCRHRSPPYALAWGQNVLASGPDKWLCVYDDQGRVMQNFDYSETDGEREASVALCSPSGQSAVFGGYNRLRSYNFNMRSQSWEEQPLKEIENLYTVTAIGWKFDGTRLSVGTLTGGVEIFDCALKRTLYKGKFEFTHVGPTQVIVKTLATGSRIVLRSNYNYEIEKINVLGGDRFLVAHTTDTLLLGDLQTCELSEIAWRGSGSEKFYFENPAVCMIYNAGELSLIEYGDNDILSVVRTEHMSPHLLSVRLNDRVRRGEGDVKKIAYLVDPKTIDVFNIVQKQSEATIHHDSRIDWLELNETGRKLLFRDKRKRLKLFDLVSQSGISILDHCSYVQWVPMSDVIVAQNRGNLCIWYNVEAPERVTTFPIRGDVVDIERVEGRTEVQVDEGVNDATYSLDEHLIEFGTAVDDGNYVRAANFLETLEVTPESQAMWKTLADLALEHAELHIAERCYAAFGNVSKARFLREVNELALELGVDDPQEHPIVRAKLAMLNKHFKLAESLLLEQGQTDASIEMYKSLHKWDDAIAVSEARRHDGLDELKASYNTYLMETKQDEKAGELKEREGDLQSALNFYMKAGLPARAANLVSSHESLSQSMDTIERVASALLKAGLNAKAGELFEMARMNQRALEAYRKGHAYRRAVDLCRAAFPHEVVAQEEAWGDYLVSQKQLDSAINHYIEAGVIEKAIEAAIQARQWNKAGQVVANLEDGEAAQRYYLIIAEHYAEVRDLKQAEKYFVEGGQPIKAVEMHMKAQNFESAHQIASKHMDTSEVSDIYRSQAEDFERKSKFKDAEKLYVKVGMPDHAIEMYKQAGRLDDMIRLVKRHHPDFLGETHVQLARELEKAQKHSQAEQHYVAGEDWKSAVNMYRTLDNWEDAYRVSKAHGGVKAAQQVGYLWARQLGGDSAVKLLTKFGMIEKAIEFACEQAATDAFEFAFDLAKAVCKSKIPQIHLKRAMFYEDQGKFMEAEAEFVSAGKPREAVLMHVHTQDWDSAQRVAERHDPSSVADVLVGQARVAFAAKKYQIAETYLLRANRPELIVDYYRKEGMWSDVLRLAEEYMPHKLEEYKRLHEAAAPSAASEDRAQELRSEARELETNQQYGEAVKAYLQLDTSATADVDVLEECWCKAIELADRFAKDMAEEAVNTAGQRLVEVGRHEVAADIYAGHDKFKEAIDAYMEGQVWARARQLANEYLPGYLETVEERYVKSLQQGGRAGDAERLMEVNSGAGLEMYAQRGDWKTCMQKAEEEGGHTLDKYAALYATKLLRDSQPFDAVSVFQQYGAPANDANLNIYRRLVVDALACKDTVTYQQWASLRDMLFELTSGYSTKDAADDAEEMQKFTTIIHYVALRAAVSAVGPLNEIGCKLSMALLRHTNRLLPPDRAFWEAGMACNQVGWESMAFVFLNRFLDLCDAIDDPENSSALDNVDFVGTDIPFEVSLPEEHWLSEEKCEEVRDYVLSISVDRKVEPSLQTDARGMYVGSLVDKLGKEYAPCIVTGFPVLSNPVQFGGQTANKEDWNRFIMTTKTTHNADLQDVMKFLAGWCGASESASYSFN